LAVILWSSHAILFHQYCLKAWGFCSVNSLAALQTLVKNLRKEARNEPAPYGSVLAWYKYIYIFFLTKCTFILVSECLPGIISVPLPGNFVREGFTLNKSH
jgi:hypothetical protein